VSTCPFDENANMISAPVMRANLQRAGFTQVHTKYGLFFPGWLKLLRFFERKLSWLPDDPVEFTQQWNVLRGIYVV
jgi:hypothetical protein